MTEIVPTPGEPVEDITLVMNAMLKAARRCAEKAVMAQDDRDSKELGQAALSFTQAFSVLDPDRLAGGDTPEARLASTPAPGTKDADGDGQIGEQ